MKKMVVTVETWREGGMFTSYCPELDVASCGHTPEEAKKNLIEVIEIQLDETASLGTLKDFLAEAGYSLGDRVLKRYQKERDFCFRAFCQGHKIRELARSETPSRDREISGDSS